jgi:hypothetical protein
MKDCTATSRFEAPAVAATSSTPRILPCEQHALFREVLLLLEKLHCSYAVAGAFALRQHTKICRDTKDLDVFLTAATASEILPIFADHGFQCEVPDPAWLAKVHRDGYFVDFITGMSNGVIVVQDSWIERAYPAKVCGVNSRVLAPEEMLASKLFVTRRERFDGADIAHIIFASQGRLNWDRILDLAGEHWELVLWALILFRYVYPAHSGYVPKSLWTELLARLAENLNSPQPAAKFRGTLVDDALFAIDVEEWGLDNLLVEQRARSAKIRPLAASKRSRSKLRGGRE